MDADVVVIGGGIAGLSVSAWLAPHCDVALLEAEDTLGYHATGRSAAIFTECLGDEPIRRLTKASRSYLVSQEDLTQPHRVMFVARPGKADQLKAFDSVLSALSPTVERFSPSDVANLCPAFGPDASSGAVVELGAMTIDVHGLQTAYTRTIRGHGGMISLSSRVESLEKKAERWHVVAGDLSISTRVVVNATGAWGDAVAEMAGVPPLGVMPLLRSVFTFATSFDSSAWPLVMDMDYEWYFKPEGPNVLGSGASEILSDPSDVRAPEIDVALGIERINEATSLAIRSVRNTWAGLRTFTPDRLPAVGFDRRNPGFFWLVGQGGSGIKTSPALGELAASLILSDAVPERLAEHGIERGLFDPRRFLA